MRRLWRIPGMTADSQQPRSREVGARHVAPLRRQIRWRSAARLIAVSCLTVLAAVAPCAAAVRIKDLVSVEGVRDNQLIGYGLVVGLNGTGDRQQTVFSTQSLSNLLRRMGVNVDPNGLRINNIAAVMVTATLPPFATPGLKLDHFRIRQ